MKKLIFLISVIISSNLGTELPDSILTSLEDLSNENKIRYLNSLCWDNRDNNPEFVIMVGKATLDLSDSLEYDDLKSETLNYVGVAYRNTGLLNTANKYFSLAYALAKKKNNLNQLGFSFNNICRVHILKGEYPQAIQNAYSAMDAFEKINDLRGIGYANLNLGRIYREQQNYQKALEYTRESVKIRELLKDQESIASAKATLAQIYTLQGEYETALKMYEVALKSYIDLNNKRGLSNVYSGIADVYFRLKDYEKSLDNINKSLSYIREIDDQYSIIVNNLVLGQIYRAKNNFEAAENTFFSIIQQTRKFGFSQSELAAYQELSKLYIQMKNYNEAIIYLQKYNSLNELIYGQKISNTIADLHATYELTKKEYENDVLKERLEEENERILLLQIIVVLILILGAVSFSKYRSNAKANKLLKELNFTKDKYFRILAHELRSPFSSILGYSDMIIYDYKDLSDKDKYNIFSEMNILLRNVYFLLDNLLNWTATQVKEVKVLPEEFRISEIVEEVKNIFSQAAKVKNISIFSDVDKELSCYSDKVMTKTILRNLVSNSLKFTRQKGKIFITAEEEEKFIKVNVRDTGVGLNKDDLNKLFNLETHFSTEGTQSEQGSGLGLLLVKEFLTQNGGTLIINPELREGLEISFTLPKVKTKSV